MLTYLNQLKQYTYRGLLRWLRAAAQPHAARLVHQLDPRQPYRLEIGHPQRVAILLVGCGGTGSFAAHILAQLAATAGLDMRLVFIDPDHVEERNLVRQNFCRAELGAPKALTLAWRYTAAFGQHIVPVVDRFQAEMLDRYRPAFAGGGSLRLVVGAVDNVCARRDIARAIEERLPHLDRRDRLFWLDAGNERVHGQVLIGNSLDPEPLLSPLGYCTHLPLPHLQEPGLLQERPRPAQEERLGCAELAALAEQSAMINRLMATWLGVYACRLLQSRDLTLQSTYVNLRTGMTRSTSITGGRVLFPERPTPQPLPMTTEEEETCSQCGGQLIEGRDEYRGVLVTVRFCERCAWSEERCPECGTAVEKTEWEQNEGGLAPTLACPRCLWHVHLEPEA